MVPLYKHPDSGYFGSGQLGAGIIPALTILLAELPRTQDSSIWHRSQLMGTAPPRTRFDYKVMDASDTLNSIPCNTPINLKCP